MKDNVNISVCIATYNGELYIKEQLSSILTQLVENDEVIISDDSSTDNTVEIIKSIGDSRIILFENQKFKSPIYNFENAIKHAKGNFIILCDQDDIWLPNKIEVMMKNLRQYDLVVSNCIITDQYLNPIKNSFFPVRFKYLSGFWRNLIKNNYIGCCMAFNCNMLKYILPFPKGISMHDLWIGLIIKLKGTVYFDRSPLILYRRHGSNASQSGEKSNYTLFFRINYRLKMLYKVILRVYFHI